MPKTAKQLMKRLDNNMAKCRIQLNQEGSISIHVFMGLIGRQMMV